MAIYNGEHSVTFSGNTMLNITRNTWKSYGLIPEKPPVFDSPEMSYADWISFSQPDYLALDKNVGRRSVPTSKKATWTFYSYHDKTVYKSNSDPSTYNGTVDPSRLYSRLLRELHGKVWAIRLDDDKPSGSNNDYYHIGLVEVTGWESNEHFSTITLEITAEPYKYLNNWPVYESAGGAKDYDVPMNTNAMTPVYLEFVLTDVSNMGDTLTISHIAYDMVTNEDVPIVLKLANVANNTRIKIDGANKTIQFGSGSNAASLIQDLWCFPSFTPQTSGVHRVHFDSDHLSYVKVSYTPRFI